MHSLYPYTAPTEAMASFLIARGPYSFVGGRSMRDCAPTEDTWHPLFGLDVGVPLELCQEHAEGMRRVRGLQIYL
jgi:hypothetical protein